MSTAAIVVTNKTVKITNPFLQWYVYVVHITQE